MVHPGRVFALLAFALALFILEAPRAAAQSCRWDGTAPLCDGACGGGETEVTRLDSIPDHWTPPEVQVVPDFGAGCFTGTKALCCKMAGVSCRWDGTAPFCDGGCHAGETQGQPPPGSSSGSSCWSGNKVYCCHSTQGPVGSVKSHLEANPKLTRYAAVWEQDAKPGIGVKVSPRSKASIGLSAMPGLSTGSKASPRFAAGRRGSPGSRLATGSFTLEKGPIISGAGATALGGGLANAPAGPAWQARHGLTAAQYQQTFDALARQGYRLVDVCGYGVGDQETYAAIWEQRPGPAWVARHGLTAAQYQQEFDRQLAQGYRLVHVSGYAVGDQERYAAIWEQRPGPAWVARHGLTAAQYQQEFDRQLAQGYRLVDVSGYNVGGQDRYAAVWEKSSGPAWEAHHAMTSAQYQQVFNTLAQKGYRLRRISAWPSGDDAHFAAIWEKSAGPSWVARHGMLADDYQEEFDKLAKQGYRLRGVCGYYIAE